jgi:hypothetical protein
MSELTTQQVDTSIERFLIWLKGYGEVSYDRMDFFSSKTGIFTKKLFYKNKLAGAPFAAYALLQETFCPSLLKLYASPRREAIGDAHYASGLLNMYKITNDNKYLSWAEHYLDELLKSSCKGYSGHCWGYTFGWQTCDGFWPSGIPLITITPYAFWAFKKHWELTGSENSKEICQSISMFALKDLNKVEMPNGTICSSYSPVDYRPVVNANTYRAAVLLEAYQMFGGEEYVKEAEESIRFVLSYQEEDGKWFYEAIGDRDRFVDNFHTCFVLRNLYRAYKVNKDEELLNSIKKGYEYYRTYLFRPDNTPLHFSEMKYNKLRKYEMYDYAEGITLGCLVKESIPGSLDFSKILASDLINRFQLKDGHFVTRVSSLGNRNTIPYHRWPQAQLFESLTSLLMLLKSF